MSTSSASCSQKGAEVQSIVAERHVKELTEINTAVEQFINNYTQQVTNTLRRERERLANNSKVPQLSVLPTPSTASTVSAATAASPSSGSSSSTAPSFFSGDFTLDDILPPAPRPKRKQQQLTATPTQSNRSSLSSSSASDLNALMVAADSVNMDGCADSDDELDTDIYGNPIKRRRSKLPLRAVLILRRWFFDHVTYPYPFDADKEQLAAEAKLTVKQVQNCQNTQHPLYIVAPVKYAHE